MNPYRSNAIAGLTILVLMVLLPLPGAVLAGRDVNELFAFPPPLDIPSSYPRFSWFAVVAMVVVLVAIAVSWMAAMQRPSFVSDQRTRATATAERTIASFPGFGWWAMGWTLGWWVLAWTRWPWFESLQRFTFFPLWLGFVVTMNALTQWRSGTCLMRRAPSRWCALFGVSAVFWWIFEWLNRFVRNWHYLGAEDFDALSYALHASLSFSTVLPAVAAVAEWLQTHSGWRRRTAAGPAWRWVDRRGSAWIGFVAGAGALGLTGAYPEWFYPALWIAPLALLLGVAVLASPRGGDHSVVFLTREIARGDWSRAATWMAAALICGFFWELWNWQSAAKWIYTVPGVERWHVFEMPLLGYCGYLPFGLECLLVVERVIGNNWTRPS